MINVSGLLPGRERDFNVLQETVERSAALLKADELEADLEEELGMQHRSEKSRNEAADPCTVAALMLTTAAVMQARLEDAGALAGKQYPKLEEVARSGRPAEKLLRSWVTILDTDYKPVFSIARDILLRVTRHTRRTAGLDAAVRGIARDAREIAGRYADMGMDHAGELFNKVMGDQASDGAYFTIPTCAVLLAELGVEALNETDWANPATWGKDRSGVFDPTCGSGTLLVAWGEAIKRRAKADSAGEADLEELHAQLVSETLMGLDINAVSLQLAGSQLTLGDPRVQYDHMNLWEMPYGWEGSGNQHAPANAGTLEVLADKRIAGCRGEPRQRGLELGPEDRTYKASDGTTRLALREDEPRRAAGDLDRW